MICPYCDSLLKETPESGTCPNCGAPLSCEIRQAQEKQKLIFPAPPLGIYENPVGHHIEITEEAIIFRKRPGLRGKLSQIKVIPFKEIKRVIMVPGKFLKGGFLSVRGEEDKYDLLPRTLDDAIGDESSISFHRNSNPTFNRVYLFLKQCADVVNAADK